MDNSHHPRSVHNQRNSQNNNQRFSNNNQRFSNSNNNQRFSNNNQRFSNNNQRFSNNNQHHNERSSHIRRSNDNKRSQPIDPHQYGKRQRLANSSRNDREQSDSEVSSSNDFEHVLNNGRNIPVEIDNRHLFNEESEYELPYNTGYVHQRVISSITTVHFMNEPQPGSSNGNTSYPYQVNSFFNVPNVTNNQTTAIVPYNNHRIPYGYDENQQSDFGFASEENFRTTDINEPIQISVPFHLEPEVVVRTLYNPPNFYTLRPREIINQPSISHTQLLYPQNRQNLYTLMENPCYTYRPFSYRNIIRGLNPQIIPIPLPMFPINNLSQRNSEREHRRNIPEILPNNSSNSENNCNWICSRTNVPSQQSDDTNNEIIAHSHNVHCNANESCRAGSSVRCEVCELLDDLQNSLDNIISSSSNNKNN